MSKDLMIPQEPILPFEQCKELKELGFDWPTNGQYYKDGTKFPNENTPQNFNERTHIISASTLSQAARWLREVKGLHVSIYPKWDFTMWAVRIHDKEGYENMPKSFDTHDSALLAGIISAINHLKETK